MQVSLPALTRLIRRRRAQTPQPRLARQRVDRPPVLRTRGRDRGTVTSILSSLVGGGVLIGMSALVVDVGQIYVERNELQRGADAAAVALAKTCAMSPSDCAYQLTKAEQYASQNATDGAARVTLICGDGPGLNPCPAASTKLSGCLNDPPEHDYIEVHVATLTADGQTILPSEFSKALAGNSDDPGRAINACARAAWGLPSGAMSTIAFTVSTCEWNLLTNSGARLPSDEGVIYVHDSDGANNCPAGPSGWDSPGGFGWLDQDQDDTTTCFALINNEVYGGEPGVSMPGDCRSVLDAAIDNQSPLAMSIFDGVKGTGQNIEYHLAGYSIFVPTGYRFSNSENFHRASATGFDPCVGQEKCFYGKFTTGVVRSGTMVQTGTNYGAVATRLVG